MIKQKAINEDTINKTYEILVDIFKKEKSQDKYFTAQSVYWDRTKRSYEPRLPGNVDDAKNSLEILVERGLAKRVIAHIGEKNKNLKLYQPIIKTN